MIDHRRDQLRFDEPQQNHGIHHTEVLWRGQTASGGKHQVQRSHLFATYRVVTYLDRVLSIRGKPLCCRRVSCHLLVATIALSHLLCPLSVCIVSTSVRPVTRLDESLTLDLPMTTVFLHVSSTFPPCTRVCL